MTIFQPLRAALVSTVLFTLLLGVGYPLAVTGVAKVAFPAQADGSLVRDKSGQVVGSALLAQGFSKPEYFHPRPSAAGANGYDASGSSGSNLGPTNPALIDRVTASAKDLSADAQGKPIPADALTTSGSGLDPDISPANAAMQAARVAKARGAPLEKVQALVAANTEGPWLGVFGQPRVNVLKLNLALDAALDGPGPAAHP